jgi:hypothetical protein
MKDWKTAFWLFLAGLVYRISHYLLFTNEIVASSDAMQNILFARKFAAGRFSEAFDTYWTPLYAILVGTVGFFIDDLILPAMIVSIVAGSLAVPLTYYLVRQSYEQRESVIAAVIAVFYPFLINSVFAIGTENIYLVLIIGALVVGWRGLKRNSAFDYFFTGILLGLAYLTRPEAIGYPFFFLLLVFAKNWLQRKFFVRRPLVQSASLLLGFALLAAPYIIYLQSATGTWTISDKVKNNVSVGLIENSRTDVPSLGLNNQKITIAVPPLALGLRETHKSFTNLLPFLLFVFIGLGLFREAWSRERLGREAYLIFFCFLTILGYIMSVVLDRYLYVLLPIFFGWIARGIVQAERWFRDSAQNWLPNKFNRPFVFKPFAVLCLVFIYLYVFPINFYVRSKESAWERNAYEERDAGLWLQENNSKPSPKIFSASFRPVFYAKGEQFWTESKDVEEVLNQIKDNKVDYVVSNERTAKGDSYLDKFTETLQNNSDFELVYQKNERCGYKISIFKSK